MIHIITPEYSPVVGGVADYTRQVAQGLVEAGESVHVWCPASGRSEGDSIHVHPELGTFGADDLDRVDVHLRQYDAPRRLLVQWVPHGFGRRAMNLAFCHWLLKRSREGDGVELMVHEPYVTFWEGTWRQSAVALVHRVMTAVLLRAADKVWVSVPAWEPMWKPYAFGRHVPFEWLPIPSALPQPEAREVERVRARFAGRSLVGHFGTFGGPVSALVTSQLEDVLDAGLDCHVLLIGSGSQEFRSSFVAKHPRAAVMLSATGTVPAAALAAHIAACDLLIQPYPDGLTSRRTTAIAGLKLGVPIVSTMGYLTEPFWKDTNAVSLLAVGDRRGATQQIGALLADSNRRVRMGATGRDVYSRVLDLSRTVNALMGKTPASGRAA